MNKIKELERQIEDLYTDLVINAQELSVNRRMHDRTSELLLVRAEIYKSICHRQVQMIDLMSVTQIRKAA